MAEPKRRTKTKDIVKHMKRYGVISDPVARDKFHTNRLSAIIFNLRERGYEIETEECTGRDEYGVNTYAKYRLVSIPSEK